MGRPGSYREFVGSAHAPPGAAAGTQGDPHGQALTVRSRALLRVFGAVHLTVAVRVDVHAVEGAVGAEVLPTVDRAVLVGVELAALGLAVPAVDDAALGAAVVVAVVQEPLDPAVRGVEGLEVVLLDQPVAAGSRSRLVPPQPAGAMSPNVTPK